MKKLKIAVFFGGCSSEYGISLESACAVIQNLDREKYEPVPVGISRAGKWYHYPGEIEKIRQDRWLNDCCIPAVLSPDRRAHKLLLLREDRIEAIQIDAAFPVMHGKCGEDGTIQGLIEIAGIPLIGCGVLASALCMDKHRAHQMAQLSGVETPKSIVIGHGFDPHSLAAISHYIGNPLFVKPVKSGSSYGITKVWKEADLLPAVKLAFQYDSEVIIEEAITGFEVGCAIMGVDSLTVGEVDEIELSGDFFDFTEKYTLRSSAIHIPARVSHETSDRIKATAKLLYKALGCTGFARVDLFLTPEGRIVFNEINTIPGFTEHSRFPGMMKASGISFPNMLDQIICLSISK